MTPEIVDSIVEAAYQQFKKLGYDNHQPQTSPEPTETAENSAIPQTPASSSEQNAQSSASKPESAAQPASQAPKTVEKSDANA